MTEGPLKKLCADERWSVGRVSDPWLIALTTFGILVLELAMIRWTSSQIRVFAYFNNVVLIAAFLGTGLGVALGRRAPGLVHAVLPVLLLFSIPLAFSERLGLVHLVFPDNSILMFGGEILSADPAVFVRNMAVFLALLTVLVLLFVCCGAPLGWLFSRRPGLDAYTADLVGSLAGVIAFAGASWLQAGPAVWLALGAVPFAWLSRRLWALPAVAAVAVLGQVSATHAVFSPYNRIELSSRPTLYRELEVNRDFHQVLLNLSEDFIGAPNLTAAQHDILRRFRMFYDLPFSINARRGSALIVGGGTGNDAQAAVRNGYAAVTSVDIDGRIVGLGRENHPEKPYDNTRVTAVIDDARAFFSRERGRTFDVVCFGLLDSHAMSSAMSTLRLDNYVYTEEGIRAAWNLVGPGGHLSLAISSYSGPWFFDRVYWTIAKATGKPPRAYYNPLLIAVTYIVGRDDAALNIAALPLQPTGPAGSRERTLTTSDDWPFLYFRPEIMPWGYAVVLAYFLLLALAAARPVFGLTLAGDRFDWALFLMGAAFLLVETRGVTSTSLLFGSTWIVNASIFGGILAMALAGNLAVRRWRWHRPLPWFSGLFASVALLRFMPVSALQGLPLLERVIAAGLFTGLPVGFAGIIVPILLARSPDPAAALGANLLGAVLGGCLEYFSMYGGLNSTALMALVLYLAAFLVLRLRIGGAPAVAAAS